MKTVNEIRNTFLDYYKKNGHTEVSSSALVPQNDPTLMFTNAGMNQFKNVFIGAEERDYKRATTSQKCLRAGGKHNDLENVGYTARHHTFFEMLGNFSFGDYFKEDAIAFAWEVVTKEFCLPKDKLLVTVYHEDEEAATIWKKVSGLSDDKIIRISTSDNFWSMGDTGPCGPCTEIFYDHGEDIWGGPPGSADEDGDRFIEIWNLVFMQYNQMEDGSRVDLPNPCIDTGMGLERLTATLNGSNCNYDIDIMRDMIEKSAELTGVDPDHKDHFVSHRVIADHVRATSFLLADGVMPSNEGRGYVLRRIMRRAMRHAYLLGGTDAMLYKIVPTLISSMGEHFGELRRAESLITETLKMEEKRFLTMLDRGMKLLDAESASLQAGDSLSGEVAFKLYDTYGFPLDLTQDSLRQRKVGVDNDGFDTCMNAQKAKARAAWSGSGDAKLEQVWFDIEDGIGATDFLGYETNQAEGVVKALLKDGTRIERAQKGDEIMLVTNQSPFYGESGGQAGDMGLVSGLEGQADVTDTKKVLGKITIHKLMVTQGTLSIDDTLVMSIDGARRDNIRAHHSATHLLHAALRQVLGDHVTQKGSLVTADRLRFDIAQPVPLTPEQINAVERVVNDEIRANTEVITRLMDKEEAVEAGAMALFGEKYDEEVRVLTMGRQDEKGRYFSVELCGGTHARRTGDIGLLTILSEGAVSSGVRRIEALAGEAALAYFNKRDAQISAIAARIKATPEEVAGRVDQLLEERKKMEAEVAQLRKQIALGGSASGAAEDDVKTIAGVSYISKVLEGFPPRDLKPMADEMKTRIGSGVIALIATNEGKASIVVGVTDDLTDRISAVDLVRVGAEALGGKGGGGRPDMAQAGGPDCGAANDAATAIEKNLAS
jgi:alanyl-tRNA synthetase